MRKSNSYQANALLVAITRLDPCAPGFKDGASEEVRALLANPLLRGYLDAWVLPALHCATGDKAYTWNRGALASDAAAIRLSIRRDKRIAELIAMRQRYVESHYGKKLRDVAVIATTWDKDTAEGRELTKLLGVNHGA